MAASEEAMGAGHPSTFTEQPAPTTRHGELSEIAHHKDGDANHGFTAPIHVDKPEEHDHSPDA